MSIGSGAGVVAAVLIGKKRRRIITAFRSGSALSAETAKTLDQLGLEPGLLLHLQRLRGVVIDAGSGRYYLDERNEARAARTRRWIGIGIVLLTLALLAVVLATR